MNKSSDDNIEMDMDKARDSENENAEDKVGETTDKDNITPEADGNSEESPVGENKEEEEPKETESDRYIRLAAEFDNYKKRTAREFGDLISRANMELLKSLVEIADNFDRAIAAQSDGNNFDAYRKGVELTYEQLTNLLKRENVTPIEAIGELFDPNCHEALMQEDSDDFEEGLICKEIQKGYRINDRILRHSRVVVSRGSKADGKEEEK